MLDPQWNGTSPARIHGLLDTLASAKDASLRGAAEAKLFRDVAPSVVMVVTNDGLGTGTVISDDGKVLTSWHVVRGAVDIGIIFKPADSGASVNPSEAVRAEILSRDETSDLALLKVTTIPRSARPVDLGVAQDVEVGEDVHAIGHPTGEGWTYTKGFISQVRNAFEWSGEDGVKHTADVIQTQTPINPGNSGGPLLSDAEQLIGVNAFKVADAEGLNFAIAISEVHRFLARPYVAPPPRKETHPDCVEKVVFEGRSEENDGLVRSIDADCDGVPDAAIFTPDDAKHGIELWLDRNGDGKIDAVIFDSNRDGRWDTSEWDSDFDGHFDLVGKHPDGGIKPSSFAPLN